MLTFKCTLGYIGNLCDQLDPLYIPAPTPTATQPSNPVDNSTAALFSPTALFGP